MDRHEKEMLEMNSKKRFYKLFKDYKEIKDSGITTMQSVEFSKELIGTRNCILSFVDSIISDSSIAIIDEEDIEAEVLGELEKATEQGLDAINKVVGEKKTRVTSNIVVSNKIINDLQPEEDFKNIIMKRIAKKISNVIINGNEKFTGKALNSSSTTLTGECSADNLRNLMLEMDEEYLANALFIISKENFKLISKEKKVNGEFYVTFNSEIGLYEIHDMPLLVVDELIDANALLVDINSAYRAIISPNIDVRDFSQDMALNYIGKNGLIISVYFDGNIKNENAIRKLA